MSRGWSTIHPATEMHFLSAPGSLYLVTLAIAAPALGSLFPLPGPDPVCLQISRKVSSASAVYYSGDPKYEKGISHWSFLSTQRSKCVVEPGKETDVAEILKIVDRTRTPFAIKGGGHAVNPGFSSTPGVHISMARFSEVKYQASSQTAEVGTGLIWDDVYAALEPYNRTVVGGRVSGVGVAGLSLGGGYSWKTNQHGLTVDTIEAFRLVKPDGSITTVTHATQPDLFLALKGTQNNFGIVTKITFKTFPQGAVWGGTAIFDGSTLDQINAATAAFYANVQDPKASMIATYGAMMTQPFVSVLMFYDGPTPPAGIFDAFLTIPALTSNVGTRSYLSLVQSSPDMPIQNPRVLFQGVPHTNITPQFLDTVVNELMSSAQLYTTSNDTYIAFAVEPFLPNILQHSNLPSAFPGTRARSYLPFNVLATWPDQASDATYAQAVKAMASRIRAAAISQGQVIPRDAPSYPNYAIYDTPLEQLFGANVPRLKKLKKKVDPKNVMGLAGGFKL
ncbi:FAD-binding domain-containing protein [Panaeolus papilionaceus]|nr:FAD-binding domain-containing protein [Panaeolus papilionaceus]